MIQFDELVAWKAPPSIDFTDVKFGNLLTEQFGNFEKPSFYPSAELQLKTRFTQQVEMNSIFVNRDILQIWKTTSCPMWEMLDQTLRNGDWN